MKSSQDWFDAGYAMPIYAISTTHRTWLFYDKLFTTPADVKTVVVDGMSVLMDAQPAEHYGKPPYRAADLGGKMGWWGVMNRNNINVLTFLSKPGAVVTDEANAIRIAKEWNAA